jgi:2-oxoglutarate ferredoxin oxidoreductase subunit alpha
VRIRAKKVEGIADFIPDVKVSGPDHGELLVVGWGGTFGAIHSAVKQLQQEGKSVASAHLRYLNPFPKNLGKVLGRYEKILVAELNLGQLALLLKGHFLVPVAELNKVQGQPFQIREVADKIREILS